MTGKTDIDIQISNQCGRLIANVIIYYNSAILSRLLEKYQTSKNAKALALLKKISPAAWQHIHFHGHYFFCGRRVPIDLDAMLANLALEEGLPQIVDSIRLDPNSRVISRHFDYSSANRAFMSRSNRPYGFTCSHISAVDAA